MSALGADRIATTARNFAAASLQLPESPSALPSLKSCVRRASASGDASSANAGTATSEASTKSARAACLFKEGSLGESFIEGSSGSINPTSLRSELREEEVVAVRRDRAGAEIRRAVEV